MRAAGLVRLEHDTWVATITGRYGDYPPRDLQGFRELNLLLAVQTLVLSLDALRKATQT